MRTAAGGLCVLSSHQIGSSYPTTSLLILEQLVEHAVSILIPHLRETHRLVYMLWSNIVLSTDKLKQKTIASKHREANKIQCQHTGYGYTHRKK